MTHFDVFSRPGRVPLDLVSLYFQRMQASPRGRETQLGRMARWPQWMWDELFSDCPALMTGFQHEVRRLILGNREHAHTVLDTSLRYYPEWISIRTRQHRTSSRMRRVYTREAREREAASWAGSHIASGLIRAQHHLAEEMPFDNRLILEVIAPALLIRTQLQLVKEPHDLQQVP